MTISISRLSGLPLLAILGLASLSACEPVQVSPEQAAAQCTERARAAQGPTGTVRVGVSTEGPVIGGEIGITDDYLQGRAPQAVYEDCVRKLTGQGPIRPLDLG